MSACWWPLNEFVHLLLLTDSSCLCRWSEFTDVVCSSWLVIPWRVPCQKRLDGTVDWHARREHNAGTAYIWRHVDWPRRINVHVYRAWRGASHFVHAHGHFPGPYGIVNANNPQVCQRISRLLRVWFSTLWISIVISKHYYYCYTSSQH